MPDPAMDEAVNLALGTRRVTIKDVARAAGVSTQTVSRVINNFSYVSDETRQRVELAVAQLGYRPSMLARSLIRQRSYTLGVVTFGLKYIGPSRTLNGIADKADELGYMLLMKKMDNFDASRIDVVIDSLLAHQVDGIIWDVPENDENRSWAEGVTSIPVPIVFMSMEPKPGYSVVSMDSYLGAQMATRHLLAQGCRHIGHISGSLVWWEARLRLQGWRDTLEKAGLQVSDRQWEQGNWSSASGAAAAERLLAKYPDMDGLFVANDQMALSVLREACRRGIKVPEQLAVVGFDGIPESAHFYPSLSTVSQDPQLLGGHAVQCLVEMVRARQENKPLETQSILIPPTLVVRESSSSAQLPGSAKEVTKA
jgi:DNA-binding LacI/PurR family transcriptional regulator